MRLEVLTDKKGGGIYVLNRPEIYIGSAENNDIVINSPEISKKHLKLIVTDDEKCFVIDQGSTNGTFLNDERIIPGRREEFRMMASIRLGDQVLLTLLDKDRGDLPELPLRQQFVEENKNVLSDPDKTRVISLKSLQKVKTEKVRKKRLKKLEKEIKKKKIARKDKATLNSAIFTALIILGIGYGAMKALQAYKTKKTRRTIIAQMKESRIMVDDTIETLDESTNANFHIPQDHLLPVADIAKHSDDVMCSLPFEMFFCKRMPRGQKRKNGALNLNGDIVVYLEQKEWMDKANALVNFHTTLNAKSEVTKNLEASADKRGAIEEDGSEQETPVEKKDESESVSMDMLNRIAFLSYLKTHLDRGLTPEIKKLNVYFVFYSQTGSMKEIQSVMAVRGDAIGQLNSRYTEDYFRFKKYSPYQIITKLERFYRIY